eukprot:955707-Heterocapsa_arctica.AAC.1
MQGRMTAPRTSKIATGTAGQHDPEVLGVALPDQAATLRATGVAPGRCKGSDRRAMNGGGRQAQS